MKINKHILEEVFVNSSACAVNSSIAMKQAQLKNRSVFIQDNILLWFARLSALPAKMYQLIKHWAATNLEGQIRAVYEITGKNSSLHSYNFLTTLLPLFLLPNYSTTQTANIKKKLS